MQLKKRKEKGEEKGKVEKVIDYGSEKITIKTNKQDGESLNKKTENLEHFFKL